jgi:DMSO/TMAO reductase YedYZ molybdopterin-dependent catalytic subunit
MLAQAAGGWMQSRRAFVRAVGAGLALAGGAWITPRARAAGLPQGTADSAALEVLPGKQALIRRSYRPPNYETPVEAFDSVLTANERFFVRWHLGNIPRLDAREWRLAVGGDAIERPMQLTLDQLKQGFKPAEVVAVCQCAGNRRGLSDPHVPGVQWGYGAMGNARWKGARLKDVLALAGLKPTALEVAFDGADEPIVDRTPDFIKSIPLWKARDDDTLIAYEMNGEPLPHWNGFPARIVVPGWTATYWLKQVIAVNVLAAPQGGFWMSTAYRIPKRRFPVIDRFVSQESEQNTPITEMVVNSLITNLTEGQRFLKGAPAVVKGLAWDGGYGIRAVEVSTDDGRSWRPAELGSELGRYSFVSWQHLFTPAEAGNTAVLARASNRLGATQTFELIFNPAGYHNNVIQRIPIQVA